MGQPSLAEVFVGESLGQNARLERIAQAIDWARLGQVVAGIHAAREGRPSYPPLLMVKVLLLEQWYSLSDPQMEEALGDRLSFRRFVGLGLEDGTPDHSTISRFRAVLETQGVSEALFLEVAAQVEAQGLVLKQGTLVDATWWRPRCAARRWRRGAVLGVPPTRTRPGRSGAGAPGPTSATRCIWGWTPTRRPWCGGPY